VSPGHWIGPYARSVTSVEKELRNLRQLVWSMIPGGMSLVAASFLGSSWYLAERIRSEALAVGPGPAMPAYDDVQFVGVAPGQVQLRAVGDQAALLKPMLCGIAWPGGIGHLGPVAAVSGGVVTRPLTVISGSAPTAGQLAALDRSYFLSDPETALGIPVQDVVVPGPLGPLPAWYFPGPGSTFIIGVHGQNGTRKDVLRVIDIVYRMGFPAVAVTYRNDLGAARDPSGYLRYGQTEWSDIEAAVRWSLAQGAQSVVLVGQSMGAGVVAAFLKRSSLAPKVARVVLDAPMLDLRAAIDYQVDRHLIPIIGRLPAPLIRTAKRIASARFGVDWSAISYLDETTWLKVPALVTHGDDDPRVPISTSLRLNELKPSLVTFEVFPGAGHLESWNIDRSRYTSLVESFLAPLAS
jgi:alpha-beta hydrolase superfamily lysophospholipase